MTEFQDGTFITMEVLGCQVHANEKATRPLFADPGHKYSLLFCQDYLNEMDYQMVKYFKMEIVKSLSSIIKLIFIIYVEDDLFVQYNCISMHVL